MADREHELGNQPIEAKFRHTLNALMHSLDGIFNGENVGPGEKTTGIVLFLFPYGDRDGRVNYISNGANRSDVCRMLEEQLIRFKTDRDDDNDILEKMSVAIGDTIGPLPINATACRMAAEAALRVYRKG